MSVKDVALALDANAVYPVKFVAVKVIGKVELVLSIEYVAPDESVKLAAAIVAGIVALVKVLIV